MDASSLDSWCFLSYSILCFLHSILLSFIDWWVLGIWYHCTVKTIKKYFGMKISSGSERVLHKRRLSALFFTRSGNKLKIKRIPTQGILMVHQDTINLYREKRSGPAESVFLFYSEQQTQDLREREENRFLLPSLLVVSLAVLVIHFLWNQVFFLLLGCFFTFSK